jgi:hypothetical protein
MCFRIDETAQRPKTKIAWKIVERTPAGYLRSMFYPQQTWQPGLEQRRLQYIWPWSSSHRKSTIRYALGGIYVFTSKRAAWIQYNPDHNIDFLMRVRVDPDEWLFTSVDGTMATYNAATPCKTQPEFDWT